MNDIIQEHLGLNDIEIKKVETNPKGDIEITVESTLEGTHCHCCQQKITRPYGYDHRLLKLRHLPIFGRPVYIRVRLPRYQCDTCDKNPTTTQQPDWHKRHSSFTVPYEEHILLATINSTETDVSRKEDITEAQVRGIIQRYIGHKINWDKVDSLTVLGIDEITLRKGHKSFIVVVSSQYRGEARIIGLLKGRKKATVKEFLLTIPDQIKKDDSMGLY